MDWVQLDGVRQNECREDECSYLKETTYEQTATIKRLKDTIRDCESKIEKIKSMQQNIDNLYAENQKLLALIDEHTINAFQEKSS